MKTLRVLIVEDYRDTADIIALWVTSEGHDAKVCFTGFQAEQAMPAFRRAIVKSCVRGNSSGGGLIASDSVFERDSLDDIGQ
jgi:hypothetical protein